jgi:Na+/H+ antiporter NhaD/arsenite permease-like protein
VKKVLLIIAVFMVFLPVVSVAQSMDEACMQAEADAEAEVDKGMWFLGGCLFGLIAVGIAYVVKPNPPASRLVGMSPEYVASYTDCYTQKGASIQTSSTMYGCLAGTGLTVVVYAIILAVAADEGL